MIKTESFATLFLVFYCPLGLGAMTLLYYGGYGEYFEAALWGSGVSVVLMWLTILGVNKLIETSVTGLLALVFGGMLFRFVCVFAAGLYVHFFTHIHLVGFFLGLVISYILLQILEIVYVQKRFGRKAGGNGNGK